MQKRSGKVREKTERSVYQDTRGNKSGKAKRTTEYNSEKRCKTIEAMRAL